MPPYNRINASQFPKTRRRRLRLNPAIRDLVREHQLKTQDLVLPLFVIEGSQTREPISAMPGVFRYSLDQAIHTAQSAWRLGIKAIALFPVIAAHHKDTHASMAYNKSNLACRAIEAIKQHCPDLLVISDVALDPFTSHGQDGLIDQEGSVLNDATLDVLVKQSLCYARAGADILAPSDMMDGRIGVIRDALEAENHSNTIILSYAAKYASAFYGPFRDAIGSNAQLKGASKASYQMDPGNLKEALEEVRLDLDEGADLVMVKPGMAYLDVVQAIKSSFSCQTWVYQVSGEYAMLKAAAAQHGLAPKASIMESLLCMKRAGADAIITYFALEVAHWLDC